MEPIRLDKERQDKLWDIAREMGNVPLSGAVAKLIDGYKGNWVAPAEPEKVIPSEPVKKPGRPKGSKDKKAN